jgi:hypothetical protein
VAYVVEAGDNQGVEQTLRDLGTARDLLHPEHDDNNAEQVTKVLMDVDSLLPVQAAAALNAASAPQDKLKKRNLGGRCHHQNRTQVR